MTKTIKLTRCLLSRIEKVKTPSEGSLYGLTDNDSIFLLGFSFGAASIEDNLPIGLTECGRIKWNRIARPGSFDWKKVSNEVCISFDFRSLTVAKKAASGEGFEVAEYGIVDEEALWTEWVLARVQFGLVVDTDTKGKGEAYGEVLRNALTELHSVIQSTNPPVFNVEDTEIYLHKEKTVSGVANASTVGDVLLELENYSDDKKPQIRRGFDVLHLDTFLNLTCETKKEDDEVDPSTGVQIHSLALVRRNSNIVDLFDTLMSSVDRNIRLVHAGATDIHRDLNTFVFYPQEIGHFVSFVYPEFAADDDAEQIEKRKQHHAALNLTNICLRRANNYNFDAQTGGKYLVNPHIGIKSTVNGGKQYLVKGNYAYHHYMQDDFNDDGWGCAYRSFQTVFSWYRFQGYTTKPVPTHEEIQQCLVDLEDKPKSFVGSRQWIGSMEVSMCLQHFLDVDSRIANVKSGADMATQGPTLAQHFVTYGSPVMIGGGVLAHTILGVDFNSETNEIKFLILDPHYTGSENLDVIQKKGWCAWKGTNFWDKKSYYNFCMPMFPNNVEY